MIVLGIETSCDETAAAVVNGDGVIIAETILSQLDEAAKQEFKYGNQTRTDDTQESDTE